MSLAKYLNDLSKDPFLAQALRCCGSPAWGEGMLARRPFADEEQVYAAADEVWFALPQDEWLAAFRAHPQIGEQARRGSFSAGEQAQTREAQSSTLAELGEWNARYLAKFGFIFIVCATGKSAEEMLELLKGRYENGVKEEFAIAAEEQGKITGIRLRQLGAGANNGC